MSKFYENDILLRENIFELNSNEYIINDAFEIKNIKKVLDVKMQLSDLIEANREKKRITGREFMTSGGEMDFELPEDGLDEE